MLIIYICKGSKNEKFYEPNGHRIFCCVYYIPYLTPSTIFLYTFTPCFYFSKIRRIAYLLPNKPYALFSCSLYIIKNLNQLFLIIIPVIKKLFNTTCGKRMNKHLFNNLIRNCGNVTSCQSRICHMYGASY